MLGSKSQYHVRSKLLIIDLEEKSLMTKEFKFRRKTAIEKLQRTLALPKVIADQQTHDQIQKVLDAFLNESIRFDYRVIREEVELVPFEVAALLDKREVGTLLGMMKQPNTRLHHFFGGQMSPLVEALYEGWQDGVPSPVTEQQSWTSTIAK